MAICILCGAEYNLDDSTIHITFTKDSTGDIDLPNFCNDKCHDEFFRARSKVRLERESCHTD